MIWNSLDRLIQLSFKKAPNMGRLKGVEDGVWEKIRASEVEPRAGLWAFLALNNTQLQYASLSLAIMAGVMGVKMSLTSPSSDALGLEIFSPSASYLMMSEIEWRGAAAS